jgi:hypothetical protein
MSHYLSLFRQANSLQKLATLIEDAEQNNSLTVYIQVITVNENYQVIIGHDMIEISLPNDLYYATFIERLPSSTNTYDIINTYDSYLHVRGKQMLLEVIYQIQLNRLTTKKCA